MATLHGFKPSAGGRQSVKSVQPFRVATDPRCKPADPCACGKARPVIAVRHADPFCSTDCCRDHYGCPR